MTRRSYFSASGISPYGKSPNSVSLLLLNYNLYDLDGVLDPVDYWIDEANLVLTLESDLNVWRRVANISQI